MGVGGRVQGGEAVSDRSCDGAVVYAHEWCPICEDNTAHIRIAEDIVECVECGEITEG